MPRDGKHYPKDVSNVLRTEALSTNRAPKSEVIPFVITYGESAKLTVSEIRKLSNETISPDQEL